MALMMKEKVTVAKEKKIMTRGRVTVMEERRRSLLED